jgi:ABC-type sugar transport system, permease component
MGRKVQSILLEIILILISLIAIIPIYMMIAGSLKTSQEAALFNIKLPTEWRFDNYAKVVEQADVFKAFLNGVIYSFSSAVVTCVVSAMAAFIIVRSNTKLLNGVYNLFIIGLIIPTNLIVSIFLLKILKIYGTFPAVILIYIALLIPFTLFLYSGFIKNINREIDEAAIIDGCNIYRLFFYIIFPLLQPVTVTAAIINIINVWNDFLIQLYFTSSSGMWSMPATVYNFFGMYGSQWNLVFADLVLTSLPMGIVFLVFQRYIISGMTAGSVKG